MILALWMKICLAVTLIGSFAGVKYYFPNYKDDNIIEEKLEELIKGKEIRLEEDSEEKDEYGRLLRYVYIDNLFI